MIREFLRFGFHNQLFVGKRDLAQSAVIAQALMDTKMAT